MEFDTTFYLVAVLAVIITGIAKSGFAGGGAMMAVPLMSLFISPQVAAAIMLPILCAIDVVNIWKYRRDWLPRLLKLLLPGAFLGIGFGWLTFHFLNASGLRIFIGGLALFFVARYLFGLSKKVIARPMGRVAGFILGSISGLTSFVAHAGGPPVEAFLLSQKINKTQIVAMNSYYFGSVNFVKLLPYFLLGQFSTQNLTTSLVLAPFVPVGIGLGYLLHKVVSQQVFMRVAYVMLTLAGIKLLWDGARGLL